MNKIISNFIEFNNLVKTTQGNFRDRVNKKTYYLHTCEYCRNEFINNTPIQTYCSNKCSRVVTSKLDETGFESINNLFNSKNYTLLNNPTKNKDIANFICNNGHKHSISVSNFKSGQMCGKCLPNINGYEFSYIKEYIESIGYKLISNEEVYKDSSSTKLLLKCPNGHEWITTFSNFKRGNRCFLCNGSSKIPFSRIKEEMELEGYNVLTTDNNFISQVKTKVKFICPNGHKHEISYRKWKLGQRCSKCMRSKHEKEVDEYLCTIYNTDDIIRNNRKIVKNGNSKYYLELDFYFPLIKKAIEINGVYWHSREDKIINDKYKIEFCKNNNIDLLIITDIEWDKNKKYCISTILNFLK